MNVIKDTHSSLEKGRPGARIRWKVLVPLLILHAGAVASLFFFTWTGFLTALGLWFCTGMFGITVGYHRMLTHRSFQCGRWVKAFHLFWSAISLQQGPISWVRIHRAHHKYTDRPEDPHGQAYGFFYGHMGWSFLAYLDRGRSELVKTLPQDLTRDPMVVFFEKIHYPAFLLSLVVFYAIDGWNLVLWAGCFRTVFVMHATWSVNSITHRMGYRNYPTDDLSTNNHLVAALTWGEGYHNNHHRFPNSARQGLKRWEIDPSWMWIRLLEQMGLAWDVRLPRHIEIASELSDREIAEHTELR